MSVRRNVGSIPCRSATETWEQIVDLITGQGSIDVRQLNAAADVLASIITDEHLSQKALVVEGVGPQLRVYCLYGMKALEEGKKVDSLTWNPTAGDWTMHVPCDAENMSWVKSALAKCSARIKVFDVDEVPRRALALADIPKKEFHSRRVIAKRRDRFLLCTRHFIRHAAAPLPGMDRSAQAKVRGARPSAPTAGSVLESEPPFATPKRAP